MIQAIETIYRGYRFRSRLEARWAVFFTTAGVAFQYEPEGFRLPSGWYLPDFFLPTFTAYLEVKPLPSPLVSMAEQQIIFNRLEPEEEGWLESVIPKLPEILPREVRLGCELVAHSSRDTSFVVVYGDPRDVVDDNNSICIDWTCPGVHASIGFLDRIPFSLYDAADAARQARFEHGENP